VAINGNGNNIWKWLAAFLAGAMLAGAPSYSLLLSKPDNNDFKDLRMQLNNLEIQNARISEQIITLQQQIDTFVLPRNVK